MCCQVGMSKYECGDTSSEESDGTSGVGNRSDVRCRKVPRQCAWCGCKESDEPCNKKFVHIRPRSRCCCHIHASSSTSASGIISKGNRETCTTHVHHASATRVKTSPSSGSSLGSRRHQCNNVSQPSGQSSREYRETRRVNLEEKERRMLLKDKLLTEREEQLKGAELLCSQREHQVEEVLTMVEKKEKQLRELQTTLFKMQQDNENANDKWQPKLSKHKTKDIPTSAPSPEADKVHGRRNWILCCPSVGSTSDIENSQYEYNKKSSYVQTTPQTSWTMLRDIKTQTSWINVSPAIRDPVMLGRANQRLWDSMVPEDYSGHMVVGTDRNPAPRHGTRNTENVSSVDRPFRASTQTQTSPACSTSNLSLNHLEPVFSRSHYSVESCMCDKDDQNLRNARKTEIVWACDSGGSLNAISKPEMISFTEHYKVESDSSMLVHRTLAVPWEVIPVNREGWHKCRTYNFPIVNVSRQTQTEGFQRRKPILLRASASDDLLYYLHGLEKGAVTTYAAEEQYPFDVFPSLIEIAFEYALYRDNHRRRVEQRRRCGQLAYDGFGPEMASPFIASPAPPAQQAISRRSVGTNINPKDMDMFNSQDTEFTIQDDYLRCSYR